MTGRNPRAALSAVVCVPCRGRLGCAWDEGFPSWSYCGSSSVNMVCVPPEFLFGCEVGLLFVKHERWCAGETPLFSQVPVSSDCGGAHTH